MDNGNTIRILCLGDSFTFGEGAPKGYSYPEQLQKMLDNNSSKKFIVCNGGVPGSNSSQLFKNLENNFQRYRSDIIVVMTGCNNNSFFNESNYFLFADKSIKVFLYRLDVCLSHMRSYKLFKVAIINFYSKIRPEARLKTEYFAGDNEVFKRSVDKVNRNKIKNVPQELIEEMKKCLALGEVYQNQKKINLAIAEFKKAIELNPYDDRPYYMLGYIYLHYSPDLKDKHKLAIQAFKKAIEINLFNEAVHLELFNVYYRIGKINLALEELDIIHQLNPNNEWVRRSLIYGIPYIKDMKIFEKMLRYDLQNIIAFITSKKSKLILQNYSSGWPNEILRQIAKINKVPFVDNEFVFKKLESLDGYKRQDYFAEDGHCNARGYKIIAENVYSMLKSEMRDLLE